MIKYVKRIELLDEEEDREEHHNEPPDQQAEQGVPTIVQHQAGQDTDTSEQHLEQKARPAEQETRQFAASQEEQVGQVTPEQAHAG